MEMREWLSIIVIIAIVLVVADGFRRKRARNPVRMKLEKTAAAREAIDEDALLSAELPHGGARSIPRSQYPGKPPASVAGRAARKGKKSRFGKKVPVLMESVDLPEGAVAQPEAPPVRASLQSDGKRGNGDDFDDDFEDDWEEEEFDEESFDEEEDDFEAEDFDEDEDEFDAGRKGYDDDFDDEDEVDLDEDEDDDFEDDDDDDDDDEFGFGDDEDEDTYDSRYQRAGTAGGGGRIEPSFGEEPVLSEEELADDRVAAAAASAVRRQEKAAIFSGARGREHQGELPLGGGQQAAEKEKNEEASGAPEKSVSPQEVIVINVMARKGEVFSGRDMLPVLMSQGLRLGDMSIFHRHADSSGNGPVMFSMANMVKPGTFDMARMEEFTTPGVSLFQQLPGPIDNMQSFERMLATANAIRDALHGDLKDENRSVLTRQTIEHYRQRIRDFELRQLAHK